MMKVTRREFAKAAAVAPLAVQAYSMGQAAPSDHFDIVVAGAGHNSLITAAYLSKAGYKCLILEGRPKIGGCVKTAQFTLSGFQHDTCSSAHSALYENPLWKDDELKLRDYGLEYIDPDPIIHMPFADGTYLTQWRNLDRTVAEFEKFSKKDAATYRRMYKDYEEVKPLFMAGTYSPVGFGKPLNELLATHPKGKFWTRRLAMSQWEIVRDSFEDDHCRSFMLTSPWGNQMPQNPLTGRSAYSSLNQLGTGRPLPKGGSGKLTEALGKLIEAHGGVILTGKPVQQLILEGGKCTGVECADGSKYYASKAVVSTIHIKHLVHMAPKELWGPDFLDGVDTWQQDPQAFVTNYAIKEPPKYTVAGGMLTSVHASLLDSPERALRFAYDFATNTVNTDKPPLHVICTSVADPTRAPAGMHTLKLLGYQPYDIKGGPEQWDEIKEQVSEANWKYLKTFAKNLSDDMILERIIESPLDIERQNPMCWHGSVHSGSQSPSQSGALRPMPGWAQYRMPIAGLYQTGANTHPGGSVTGAPGRNAAVVMLKDFGTSIETVVGKNSSKG